MHAVDAEEFLTEDRLNIFIFLIRIESYILIENRYLKAIKLFDY